jgi:hypothetical protein
MLVLAVLAIAVISANAQLTDDNIATWEMNPYAWEGKPLPTLGLQNSTHPLSLSYNLHETGLPAKVDWRDTPNGTRVTPVKDQDGCGACVAYAIVGQIESALEIAQNSNKPLPDLAEMEFFRGSCANGWIFEKAYPVARDTGIMTQNCYDSGTCKDRVAITSWSTTKNPKEALQNGPIVTGVAWDSQWFNYDSGIINEYTGDVAGGHALCVVGYDDPHNCWIVKNSWGTGWGESGYFRIDYTTAAEAGMGTSYPWYVVTVKGSPGPGPIPPSADITVVKNGNFLISQISRMSTGKLVLNNNTLPAIPRFYFTSLGTFKKGDTLNFTMLGTDGKTYNNDKVSAFGFSNWYLTETTPKGSTTFQIIAK